MKINRLLKYYILKEPLKEIEMDSILDKISNKIVLTERESKFLELYTQTSGEHYKDYMLLSKNSVYNRIKQLLDNKESVVCDLTDRDGKIGLPIIDIFNDIELEYGSVKTKDEKCHKLYDSFLYNIIYNNKRSEYSLQKHDEYYEKIEASYGN